MRSYARIPNKAKTKLFWVEVNTDANGFNDQVWLTTLIQTLLLNLGESPFFSSFGIPTQQTVVQQVFPNYYVTLTQQSYAQYFVSLAITQEQNPTPTYNISVITHQGAQLIGTTVEAGGGSGQYITTPEGNPILTPGSGGVEILV
jgi:hypothetical protein